MKKILFACALLVGVWACDRDDPDAQGTPMERLTGTGEKKWRLSKAVAWSQGAEINMFQLEEGCLVDSELLLRTDGSYVMLDVGKLCSSADRVENTWMLEEEPLKIRLAELSLLGRSLSNVALDIKSLKHSSFLGVSDEVPENYLGIDKIELTFSEIK